MIELLVPVAALYLLHKANLINLDFPLRRLVRWRRGGAAFAPEPKAGLFSGEAETEAARLVATYGLGAWEARANRHDFAVSLGYLQGLERAFREAGVTLPAQVSALDAGPSDWFYVQAQHALLSRYGAENPREVALDGVELDAYRLYKNLRSRHDWAMCYIGDLAGVRYMAQDVRRYDRPVDLAFMLYPFLFADDHNRWGLPRGLLRPEALLAHVSGLIRPGGYLVIANQGAAEREAQHRLLEAAGLSVIWWSRHDTALFAFEPERYLTVVRIPG
jgi:hypothetical protein